MDVHELKGREDTLKKFVKKNCVLCMGRSRLHTNAGAKNPEKAQVQAGLKSLYSVYQDKFEFLRKTNADASDIGIAGENKRIVLDIIDECSACQRDIDRANRGLAILK